MCCALSPTAKYLIEENYSGPMAGLFWWQNIMYSDVVNHCTSCPQCAINCQLLRENQQTSTAPNTCPKDFPNCSSQWNELAKNRNMQ